ncbi:hypothetical protein EC957_005110 [Mortierella hygrophila]|uniref:Uncharacterized protein n=1 Tax=Mortierella hygrophila TaxID=979708 RepID=A0A9P6F1C9_9FUNG|nr:hypothetical protein EC957_005110 [Mortierella hygrophila]
MLARVAFMALTTALALLVAGPTPVMSLPVGGGDEPLVVTEALRLPTITTSHPTLYYNGPSTTTKIPYAHATGTPSSSEDTQELLDLVYNPPHRHQPPSTIRSPYRYTYGNGLDRYDDDDDEEDDDTIPTEYLPRLTSTSYPDTAGKRDGNVQRPLVVVEQNSARPELEGGDDESTWLGGEEETSSLNRPEPEDIAEDWLFPFSRPRPQKSSCEERTGRQIGIDLRENEFSVGFVNAEGKAELIPNEEGKLYTPADVRFIDGGRRAIVGSSAWSTSGNTTRELRNQVDLSKLRDAHAYKLYPEAVRFGLSGMAPTKVNVDNFDTFEDHLEREVLERLGLLQEEGHILAVLMQRAVDIAEAYLEEKIEGVLVTYPKKVLKYGAIGDLFLRDTIFDSSREKEIMQAGPRVRQLESYDYFTEILALMAGHISFFESRLQRKPDVSRGYWNSKYLSQIVLLYNLRDSSEDLVVMRYTKGAYGRRSFHLDFVSGYLPNDGNIQAQFSRYMIKYVLDRFNRGVGVRGTDRSHKDAVDSEYLLHYDTLIGSMEGYSTMSPARDDWESRFQITKDSYVIVTIKDYRECKMRFLKERLTATVEQVRADAGIEDWSQIDHLVVADASQFQVQSTVVLEDIVFGGKSEKTVTEVDPQKAIAEGIAILAGETDTKAQNRCDTV